MLSPVSAVMGGHLQAGIPIPPLYVHSTGASIPMGQGGRVPPNIWSCLLYTSDAADE